MTRILREITLDDIERRFPLGAYWFGQRWCPPVFRNGGGYFIRVQVAETTRGADTNTRFDYFELAGDGTVVAAPRGHAKDYKPGRVVGLDAAVKRHADPDPTALRLNFGGI